MNNLIGEINFFVFEQLLNIKTIWFYLIPLKFKKVKLSSLNEKQKIIKNKLKTLDKKSFEYEDNKNIYNY